MNREIIYSINGSTFKYAFGVNVEASSGFGMLKRKQPQEYNFPDQHGDSWDLENPYYESRDMTLDCWISAKDWGTLYDNFNKFKAEFMKPGTQRLLIQYPPNVKDREYRVVLMDGIDLDARIKQGKCFGKFTVRLKEINPIKRVLRYYGAGSPQLRYKSDSETEIFISSGETFTVNGDADFQLDLAPMNWIGGSNYPGRNLLSDTWYVNVYDLEPLEIKPIQPYLHGGGDTVFVRVQGAEFEGESTGFFMIELRPYSNTLPTIWLEYDANELYSEEGRVRTAHLLTSSYRVFVHNTDYTGEFNGSTLMIEGLSLTRNQPVDYYLPAPEENKSIIIAGDIRKLKNFYFEGQTLWTEL